MTAAVCPQRTCGPLQWTPFSPVFWRVSPQVAACRRADLPDRRVSANRLTIGEALVPARHDATNCRTAALTPTNDSLRPGRGEVKPDPPDAGLHHGAHLPQLVPQRAHLGA